MKGFVNSLPPYALQRLGGGKCGVVAFETAREGGV